MGTISVSLPSDGTTADVSDYNTPINTIVNEINGELDNANIASDAAIAGSKLADDSITASKVDFGGAGNGIWWEEIARTTLTSAGDTITVSDIPARKYLKIIVSVGDTGGTIDMDLRLNNDSGTNYAYRVSTDGAADGVVTSGTFISLQVTGLASRQFAEVDIANDASDEKGIIASVVANNTAEATNVPSRRVLAGKWTNIANQVTRVDILNNEAGSYAIGSEVIVLGHD